MSRLFSPPYSGPLGQGREPDFFLPLNGRKSKVQEQRQRAVQLGVSLWLILCWMIASIWLISARQDERSTVEVQERQGVIAALFPEEADNH